MPVFGHRGSGGGGSANGLRVTPGVEIIGGEIDVTQPQSYADIAVNTAFTLSDTPANGTRLAVEITNTSGNVLTVAIPESYSPARDATISGITLAANETVMLVFYQDIDRMIVEGDSVTIADLPLSVLPSGTTFLLQGYNEVTGRHEHIAAEDLPPPLRPPIDKSVDYTLEVTDAEGYLRMTSGSNRTFIVPANVDVAIAIGAKIGLRKTEETGNLTLEEAPGVYVNVNPDKRRILNQEGFTAQLIKVAANEWDLSGDLADYTPGTYLTLRDHQNGPSSGNVNTSVFFYQASKFTAHWDYPIGKLTFSGWKNGAPTGQLHIEIWSDNAGAPGAVVAAAEDFDVETFSGSEVTFSVNINLTPVQGIVYWIVFYRDTADGVTDLVRLGWIFTGVSAQQIDSSANPGAGWLVAGTSACLVFALYSK